MDKKQKISKTSRKKIKINYPRFLSTILPFLLGTALIVYGNLKTNNQQCYRKVVLEGNKLIESIPSNLKGQVPQEKSQCYEFQAKADQLLTLNTNTKVTLVDPDNETTALQGNSKNISLKTGRYLLVLQNKSSQSSLDFEITITLISPTTSPQFSQNSAATLQPNKNPNHQTIPNSQSLPRTPPLTTNLNTNIYNSRQDPPFLQDQNLQNIVKGVVDLARVRGLPIDRLSISLVNLNLNQSQCCGYAFYLHGEPRYPASIVKLFWLVAFYSQKNSQGISSNSISPEDKKLLAKMIKDSDNESASDILDTLTGTKSTKEKLSSEQLNFWIQKRYSINNFFAHAGYSDINISQKTFPIPKLLNSPEGPDLQIRQINGKDSPPDRNALTTYSVARLLYEIEREQAISQFSSQAIKKLIQRKLEPQAWQDKPYNAIEGFLGQGLPINTQFYSKMGWTFSNRNDAAIIATPDGRTHYILVVFGDDPKYYEDKKFFPKLSRQIYEQMKHF